MSPFQPNNHQTAEAAVGEMVSYFGFIGPGIIMADKWKLKNGVWDGNNIFNQFMSVDVVLFIQQRATCMFREIQTLHRLK